MGGQNLLFHSQRTQPPSPANLFSPFLHPLRPSQASISNTLLSFPHLSFSGLVPPRGIKNKSAQLRLHQQSSRSQQVRHPASQPISEAPKSHSRLVRIPITTNHHPVIRSGRPQMSSSVLSVLPDPVSSVLRPLSRKRKEKIMC